MDGGVTEPMWERKKLEVRRLEADIETHLIRLENVDCTADGFEGVQELRNEASRLVNALRGSARVLSDWAEASKGRNAAALRQQAERCEEVAAEKDRALTHISQSLNAKRARHSLLSDVHQEIEEYTESQSSRLLHKEADHISKAHSQVNNLRDQALENHQQLRDQHTTLTHAQERIGNIVGAIPGIDSVLGKIRNKRHRDTIVIGVLVAFCLFLIYVFW